jgi:hypothetical protein
MDGRLVYYRTSSTRRSRHVEHAIEVRSKLVICFILWACLAGLSLGSRGFRSELKQGELGTSFYYNYSRCAVLHLSWSESLSSALKGEGAS